MIINGQAPQNATLLTDDEMRNIKALWHVVKTKHTYWVGGYWINIYIKVKITVKIPYPYLQWVPGYLWKGWLPIPGHYEPRIGWYTKTIGTYIRVSRYIPRRKITYYTYKIEPDITISGKISKYPVTNELTLNQAQGIVQNHPNAFQYDARGTLQEQLKDPDQQASLM